ncbi:carbohydrate ABC transporter substrate-binding protein (CUT1 family) [Mobilisporobacter senegalensis]|uniref:Carbohydrate ABC transporter substrate-binding protein (CUT1 family) n=1 Tax=Mobilisporobacter senegalensis TaxID=1329262 RepID=A0A3N1XKH7_9FIRM|nr:extracellular solute-binding protein [Mobilisporobacter senegalensis]ROR27203.1 carbohydrate ABC transporter substrate-binding protein (CUT1 family) [Mobilisporobacter senegalensis]
MKKVSKKLIALLLVGVLTMSMAACGNKEKEAATNDTTNEAATDDAAKTEDDAAEAVTLNVWHQWSNDTNELKKIYDQAVADYIAENPNVTINTQTLDTEAYKTKISAEFAGNASGIDVFYYWGAGMAKKLVNADKLLPLDDYLTDDVKAKILPGSTSAFEYGGKTYSVPMFSWFMTLYANKELFEKAGAALPTTYDELLDACKKLSALDGVTPIAAGAKDGWNAAFIYQALALREVGGSNINAMLSGEKPFEDQGYTDAANKVVELYNAGAFGKNPLETGNDDANSSFISGNAAMRIMGSWFANQVYTDATATINPENVVALKIPMIPGKGNETDYAGGFIESFWVNKNTKYADEAAKFAIYINEKMGKAAYETGTGFCGWDVELDESKLNPLFVQIKGLLGESVEGVLAWDTSLESNPATIHNEQVQTLFAPNADVDAFIEEHKGAINQ